MQPGDISSTLVKYLCEQETLRQLQSTSHVAGRPFINFCQHSMWQRDLCKLLSIFCADGRVSISLSQPSVLWETFCHLLPLFYAAGRPAMNFRQLSVPPEHLWSSSINLPCGRENFCQLSLTFRMAFRLDCRRSVNFSQHSVHPRDLPSTSV